MRLTCVTVTGADESVDPADLCRLHDQFPFVEFGILLSRSREGKEPRYPGPSWLLRLLCAGVQHGARSAAGHWQLRLAGHLCGAWSREAVDGPFLWPVERPQAFSLFRRIQLNGAGYDPITLDRVGQYVARVPGKEFIIQVRSFPLIAGPGSPSLLLDNSGGRGVELTMFPDPTTGVRCGYSGGIGPENLKSALDAITSIPLDCGVWVDMESKVRSDVNGASVFDLAKVRRCLEIAAPYVAKGA